MGFRSVLAALVALAGCSTPAGSGQPAAAPEAAPVTTAAGAPAPAEPVRDRMFKHFIRIAALERALVEGDDEAVRQHAVELGKPRTGDPDEWAPHVANFRRAAGAVVRAPNHREAAIATATVVGQCGACHAAFAVTIADREVPDPPGNATVAQKMKRHQWATDLLRTGLVFSSDRLWTRGAAALSDAALHPAEVTGPGPVDPEIAVLVGHVRQLAGDARAAPADQRQGIYGAVLGTCVRCHDKLK